MEIIVNPAAHGGRAMERWEGIEGEVRRRLGAASVLVSSGVEETVSRVRESLAMGERDFVAAGGDGTVRLLAQAILDHAGRGIGEVRLGAIGLGSSNDFHKPLDPSRRIGGFPSRIDFAAAEPRDVGVLQCGGDQAPRYWLLNASCGLTAEANRIFNHPDPILRGLKRCGTDAAILYAALRALAGNRARPMRIESGAGRFGCPDVVNLGIVISPHFTGGLRYDSPFEPRSGTFHVHLCRERFLMGKIRTLAGLAGGHFMGRGRTRSWRSNRLTVRSQESIPVEYDGETIETSLASFSIRPGILRVCT